MSLRSLKAVAFLAAALVPSIAGANDSTAELRAGGLVLTKTAQIAMASEDLFLSRDRVRVIYQFENLSGADIEAEVAFPLPDLPGGETVIEIPNPASDNFVNFSTKIDGAPVSLNVEQRAFLDGKEVTDVLRARKIPLSPRHPDVSAAVLALAPADREALEKSGLVLRQDYNAGAGWEVGYTANWTLKTRFWRKQTFPAGRLVRVEHTYQPVVGASAGTILATRSSEYAAERAAEEKAYCVDARTKRELARRMKGRGEGDMMTVTFGYVLSTGANWAGPIRDFRLVVDKGEPDNLVSFCAANVRKLDATRFEVRRKDFTPTSDLAVIILRPPGKGLD